MWLKCTNRTHFNRFRLKHGRIPGDSGYQTPTMLYKMAAAREVLFKDEEPLDKSDDELENLAACYLQSERAATSRISGYVEDTVRNYSDATFKRNFRMSRDTFQWPQGLLQACSRGYCQVLVGTCRFSCLVPVPSCCLLLPRISSSVVSIYLNTELRWGSSFFPSFLPL